MGGGFAKNGNPNSNGTGLIEAADMDLIVVVFNYRVGAYGFLTTGDVERDDIDSNVGLLDQRMVLEWVQEHVGNFGGDPRRVVLGGASAGAASVALHLTAYDGRDKGLFIGTTAESSSFGPMLTAAQSRYQFVALAQSVGCWVADNDTAVLQCLRSLSATELQAGNKAVAYPAFETTTGAPAYMWSPFIDGELIRDLTWRRYLEGRFIRVPTIFGDDMNGGTNFAPKTAATLAESNNFMRNNYPTLTDAQLQVLNELYPNPNATSCPNVGCYWRQASNVYGETRYMCPSLYLSNLLTTKNTRRHCGGNRAPTYTYLWDVEDPTANATGFGVTHVVETFALFGPYNNFVSGSPASYYPGGINAKASPIVQAYWTSFIRTLDPNRYRYPGSAKWTPWTSKDEQTRIRFGTGGTTDMESIEAGLRKRCEYLQSITLSLIQ
jgi:carboxylesterase type B